MRAELLNLTKKTIFKYLSEEQIFERYLGFTPELDAMYCNPKRKDTTPGCSFYYRESDHRLIFHDFAWGVHWDCFDVVQFDYTCTFPQALEKIANDFGLNHSTKVFVKRPESVDLPRHKVGNKIRIVRKVYTKRELAFWNIGGLEILEEDLRNNKIYSISHLWEHTAKGILESFGLNMTFAYHFGGYKYQIYRPLKDRTQRRFISPYKVKLGDLEFIDYKQSYVVITKSKKDAFYLRMLGINVFFIINEAVYLEDEAIEILNKFDQVFTLFDNDRPGILATIRFRNNYRTIPTFVPRPYKDFTDWLRGDGVEKLREDLKKLKEILL